MNVDTWFFNLSKPLQIVLLCIPFVGWIVDALVRWSIYIKKNTTTNLVMAIVITLIGESWIVTLFDGIWYAVQGSLFFQE